MAARALLRLALAALAAATSPDARAADATVATSAADASPPPGWSLGLGAREEYRFRGSAQPAETDQDLHLALDLAAQDPAGKLAAAASLGLWWDLDAAPPGEPFGLASIRDPRNPWLDVYQLSAEYRSQGVLRTARAGRQVAEHGRPATFDGAYLRLQPLRSLGLFAFGGRTEHFFETGAGFFEDWLASAGVTVRPSPDLRLELDYRLLREAIDSLDAGRVDVTDHSYGAAVWWRQGEWLRTRAFVRGLDDRVSEAGAQASLHWLAVLAGLELRLRAQPTTLGELNESDNPFFLTLGPSLPHVRWRADAWKAWEPESFRLELHLGYEGRQLLLIAFLVIVVQGSDVLQYVWGKLFGRHAVAPELSPSKTWEGLVGGVASATALGAALHWITPFSPLQAAGLAFVMCVMGFLGGLVMSAIKRDRGVKDWGAMIEGHGGMLDRVDSISFSAPIFFHIVRYGWVA